MQQVSAGEPTRPADGGEGDQLRHADQARYDALAAWRTRHLTLACSASRVHLNATMDRALLRCNAQQRREILAAADKMLTTGTYKMEDLPQPFRRILKQADDEARRQVELKQQAVEAKYQRRLARLDEEVAQRSERDKVKVLQLTQTDSG